MKNLAKIALLVSLSFFTTPLTRTAMGDNDKTMLYAEFLQQYIKGGQVDYTGFKKKEAQLDVFL